MNLFGDTFLLAIELLSDLLRKNKILRNFLLIFSILSLIFVVCVFYFFYHAMDENSFVIAIISLFISIILFIPSLLAFSKEPINIRNPVEVELKMLSEERVELKRKVDMNDPESVESVFNIIQLNLNQTTEYYTINKSQARKSFGMSLTAIIAGFITILLGIWLVYFDDKLSISIISVASGILLEFIGAMYFVVYNKSLKQLNFFYSKLEKVQDTMIAIELTNSINNEAKKIELQEKIVINLIERSSKD